MPTKTKPQPKTKPMSTARPDPRDEVLTLADETIRSLARMAQEATSAMVASYWTKRNALRGA